MVQGHSSAIVLRLSPSNLLNLSPHATTGLTEVPVKHNMPHYSLVARPRGSPTVYWQ